jgi:hypothetical protein
MLAAGVLQTLGLLLGGCDQPTNQPPSSHLAPLAAAVVQGTGAQPARPERLADLTATYKAASDALSEAANKELVSATPLAHCSARPASLMRLRPPP